MDEEKIRFSVEISDKANKALERDAAKNIRSRKAQAEFILEQYYAGAKAPQTEEPEAVAA